MATEKKLKGTSLKLYKNVEYIYMYFEDALAPGLKWVRDGNLMHLSTNRTLMVNYDNKVFKEV